MSDAAPSRSIRSAASCSRNRLAVEHGAVVREPAMEFVSGDRYASILDPCGIRWTIMSRVEDLPEEESFRRVNEWSKSFG